MGPFHPPRRDPTADDEPLPPALAVRLRGLARRLWGGLVDVALPPVCLACRGAVDAAGCLCGACWSRLDFIAPPLCDRLGTPLPYGFGEGPLVSAAARDAPPAYGRARAVATFGEVARDLIHALKYADRLDIAPPMGRMMARAGRGMSSSAVMPNTQAVSAT